jgi:hypothetical protein
MISVQAISHMVKETMSTNRSHPSHEAAKDKENTFNAVLNKIQS